MVPLNNLRFLIRGQEQNPENYHLVVVYLFNFLKLNLCAWVFHVHVHLLIIYISRFCGGKKMTLDLTEFEAQLVVSCCLGAGTQPQLLEKLASAFHS